MNYRRNRRLVYMRRYFCDSRTCRTRLLAPAIDFYSGIIITDGRGKGKQRALEITRRDDQQIATFRDELYRDGKSLGRLCACVCVCVCVCNSVLSLSLSLFSRSWAVLFAIYIRLCENRITICPATKLAKLARFVRKITRLKNAAARLALYWLRNAVAHECIDRGVLPSRDGEEFAGFVTRSNFGDPRFERKRERERERGGTIESRSIR